MGNIIDRDLLYYTMALQEKEQIGAQACKLLIQHFGSAKAVIEAPIQQLEKIEGIGTVRAQTIKSAVNNQRIETEINFIEKNNIRTHFLFDKSYPLNLKQIPDAPLLLFSKGNFDIHHPRKIAIVGTRNISEYGKHITQELILQLKPYDVQIISGMAYGIDITAHRYCVQQQVPTIGVVAHGLDKMYPSAHQSTGTTMLENGGILTEYFTGTNPDRYNFPMRNRIVAGMSDMTIVVESKKKGGALITAKLASAYNREVGAVPGKIKDERSEGCNYLIKKQIAHLIESAEDIVSILDWDQGQRQAAQARLFLDLNTEEQKLVDILRTKESMHIDEIMIKSGISYSLLASILLNLELANVVKPLSGKRYRLM